MRARRSSKGCIVSARVAMLTATGEWRVRIDEGRVGAKASTEAAKTPKATAARIILSKKWRDNRSCVLPLDEERGFRSLTLPPAALPLPQKKFLP